MISEIQSEVAHILFLFYTSIGVIQRDAPPLGTGEQVESAHSLRLENNMSELIGSLVTTRRRVMEKCRELESLREECSEEELARLKEESSLLDGDIKREIERMATDLPFFKRFLEKKLQESEFCVDK
jgi:hypothetical protein